MEIIEIMQPDWSKVRALRERTHANEIIAEMGRLANKVENEEDPEKVELITEQLDMLLEGPMTAEDVGMILIRQIAGWRWRVAECLHQCGRHSSASVMWSITVAAEAKAADISDEAVRKTIKRSSGEGSKPARDLFSNFKDLDAPGCAHHLMTSIDNEIAGTLRMLADSFAKSREFVMAHQARLREDENFDQSDWRELDWPTLFHSVGVPFDPIALSIIEMHPGDESLARNKYDQLHEAFNVALNHDSKGNCEPLGPNERSTVEQALTAILDMAEPRGLDEVRANGQGSLGMSQ